MDKLGSFDRLWIPGVRRVTVSYQIETELAFALLVTPKYKFGSIPELRVKVTIIDEMIRALPTDIP